MHVSSAMAKHQHMARAAASMWRNCHRRVCPRYVSHVRCAISSGSQQVIEQYSISVSMIDLTANSADTTCQLLQPLCSQSKLDKPTTPPPSFRLPLVKLEKSRNFKRLFLLLLHADITSKFHKTHAVGHPACYTVISLPLGVAAVQTPRNATMDLIVRPWNTRTSVFSCAAPALLRLRPCPAHIVAIVVALEQPPRGHRHFSVRTFGEAAHF